MKRIKVISSSETKNIVYPEQQNDLYVKNSNTNSAGLALIPSNGIIKIPSGYNVVHIPTDIIVKAITPNPKNLFILAIDSCAETIGNKLYRNSWGTNIPDRTFIPAGYYITRFDAEDDFLLKVLPEDSEYSESLIPQTISTFCKEELISYIRSKRLRLYKDSYIVCHFTSIPYCLLFIQKDIHYTFKETLDPDTGKGSISYLNNKKLFKEVLKSLNKYYIAFMPMLITNPFLGSNNLLVEAEDLKVFTIDDINNW